MIVKTKRGYEVISHKTGRSLGIYKNKPLAEKRLKQVKFFGSKS
jgi:hypothetical protein